MLVTASAEMSQCLEVISWGHREREREDGGGDKGEMGKEGKGINLIKNIFRACLLICVVLGLGRAAENGVEGKSRLLGLFEADKKNKHTFHVQEDKSPFSQSQDNPVIY